MSPLESTLQAIDALHSQDPKTVNGKAQELVYAEHMSAWLKHLNPQASEELQIAVRSQHLCRWELPRADFPEGRTGYLKWRMEQFRLHGEKAAEVMRNQGFNQDSRDRVIAIIRKQNLKRDNDVQTLEDCACLVFLEHEFQVFSNKYEEEKIIRIVQKTWKKMSHQAQQTALGLNFSKQELALIEAALA